MEHPPKHSQEPPDLQPPDLDSLLNQSIAFGTRIFKIHGAKSMILAPSCQGPGKKVFSGISSLLTTHLIIHPIYFQHQELSTRVTLRELLQSLG